MRTLLELSTLTNNQNHYMLDIYFKRDYLVFIEINQARHFGVFPNIAVFFFSRVRQYVSDIVNKFKRRKRNCRRRKFSSDRLEARRETSLTSPRRHLHTWVFMRGGSFRRHITGSGIVSREYATLSGKRLRERQRDIVR